MTRFIALTAALWAVVAAVAISTMPAAGETLRTEEHPAITICDVFGERDCRDALSVSWCESRFDTDARNGQYLGLFQMGSWERRTFGHGSGARAQARAARRYFLRSGRDWSPWECKPTRGGS